MVMRSHQSTNTSKINTKHHPKRPSREAGSCMGAHTCLSDKPELCPSGPVFCDNGSGDILSFDAVAIVGCGMCHCVG